MQRDDSIRVLRGRPLPPRAIALYPPLTHSALHCWGASQNMITDLIRSSGTVIGSTALTRWISAWEALNQPAPNLCDVFGRRVTCLE
jgi:hypothetical protein